MLFRWFEKALMIKHFSDVKHLGVTYQTARIMVGRKTTVGDDNEKMYLLWRKKYWATAGGASPLKSETQIGWSRFRTSLLFCWITLLMVSRTNDDLDTPSNSAQKTLSRQSISDCASSDELNETSKPSGEWWMEISSEFSSVAQNSTSRAWGTEKPTWKTRSIASSQRLHTKFFNFAIIKRKSNSARSQDVAAS